MDKQEILRAFNNLSNALNEVLEGFEGDLISDLKEEREHFIVEWFEKGECVALPLLAFKNEQGLWECSENNIVFEPQPTHIVCKPIQPPKDKE